MIANARLVATRANASPLMSNAPGPAMADSKYPKYGPPNSHTSSTAWARFAANAHQSGGRAGVGSCHFPPNATADYDYANPRAVESDADDWLRYPTLTGARRVVTRETWGGPDYHREYMRWWFRHLPRAPGVAPDGKLNNWWSYVTEFDSLVIKSTA